MIKKIVASEGKRYLFFPPCIPFCWIVWASALLFPILFLTKMEKMCFLSQREPSITLNLFRSFYTYVEILRYHGAACPGSETPWEIAYLILSAHIQSQSLSNSGLSFISSFEFTILLVCMRYCLNFNLRREKKEL